MASKAPIHVTGDVSRTAGLYSWERLNEALSYQKFGSSRLQLVRDGEPVPPSVYQARENGAETCSLRISNLSWLLHQGATLKINQIDETEPGLACLTNSIGHHLHARVSFSLYAGTRAVPADGSRCEVSETLLIQIAGRARCRIVAPANALVPRPEVDPGVAGSETCVWDSSLSEGAVLYVPSRLSFVTMPDNQPSIQLKATIIVPSGLDLLQWTIRHLSSRPMLQAPIPYWLSESERGKHLDDLVHIISQALPSDSISRFMLEQEERLASLGVVNLPEMAVLGSAGIEGSTVVRLTPGRPLAITVKKYAVQVHTRNNTLSFDPSLAAALQFLNVRGSTTVEDLLCASRQPPLERLVKEMVVALLREGLLMTESDR